MADNGETRPTVREAIQGGAPWRTPVRLANMQAEPDRPPEYTHDEFYSNVLHIKPHEHAAWIGMTGKGKTSGMIKAMATHARLYPHVDYTLMVGKPHKGPHYRGRRATGDETVSRLVRQYGGRIIRDYPPRPRLPWERRHTFTALWPKSGEDPRLDTVQHARTFERFMLDRYAKGGGVVGADEVVYLDKELDLGDLLDHQWRMGRGMDAPVWSGSQMPTFLNRKAFSMSSHLILNPDNDKDARRRYAEISSLDTDLIMWQFNRVRQHKFGALYIHTDAEDGPEWAILK
jgi:hypothetical protein